MSLETPPEALRLAATLAKQWRRQRQLALLFDFDGTLAELVDRPDDAALTDRTLDALRALAAAPGILAGVVSGRSLSDVMKRVEVDGFCFSGNHGLETCIDGAVEDHPGVAACMDSLWGARATLQLLLTQFPGRGAWLEDKRLTLALHYRTVPRSEQQAVRDRVVEALLGIGGVRVTEGKHVVEVRPDLNWHKGDSVLHLVRARGIRDDVSIIYFGDDRTDEDAFQRLAETGRGDGVFIGGNDQPSLASYRLGSPHELTVTLEEVMRQRPWQG